MNHFIKSVKKSVSAMWLKALAIVMATSAMAGTALAQTSTLPTTDLTKDTSNGKKISDVANNLNTAAQTGASLMIQLVAIGGFVVVAISLYTLWKASKDEREKPLSAIDGLFIGGAMAAVASIVWIMKNTITG